MTQEITQAEAVPVKRDFALVEAQIRDIDPQVPVDVIADLRTFVEGLQRWAKQTLAALDAKMIAHIQVNGPMQWATDAEGHHRRFWIGKSKTTRCKNPQRVFEVLAQWDINDALGFLSSNAWKYGMIRKLLTSAGQPKVWDELFEIVEKPVLETDEPELQQIDERFLK